MQWKRKLVTRTTPAIQIRVFMKGNVWILATWISGVFAMKALVVTYVKKVFFD